MRAVAAQGRTVDSLRVAVLAALNLADELSQARQAGGGDARLTHARAASLRGLLDEVLEDERKTGSVDSCALFESERQPQKRRVKNVSHRGHLAQDL